MEPPPEVVANLTILAREVLDPTRAACAMPIVVTSGYRPAALNALIGGSPTSDHLLGLAADIHALGHTVDWLLIKIRGLQGLPLKQAIVEFGQWVHVSVDLSSTPKREFLAASREAGRTVYRALPS